MNGLSIEQIPDLIKTTLPHFANRGRFEAAYELQKFYFIDTVFQQDKQQVQDGKHIEWTVVLDENGTARHTGLYATRQRNKRNVVKTGTSRWTFADAEAYYEAHEVTMNRGASAIAKYIRTQFFAAYLSIANLIERRAVLVPEDAADTENPQGVPWWINMLDAGVTNYTGGFLGKTARYADGTTTTLVGGIDGATEPLWRNWAVNGSGVNMATMDALRRGMIFTDFRPPRTVKEMVRGPASKYRILTSLSYQADYERLANQGPENRNGDLNPFRGMLTFRGVPWIGMPTLEDTAYNPIYVVDFNHFQPVVHADWWMKEDEPMRDVDQRHVIVQGIDCQYGYKSKNKRQGGFVLHEPIP